MGHVSIVLPRNSRPCIGCVRRQSERRIQKQPTSRSGVIRHENIVGTNIGNTDENARGGRTSRTGSGIERNPRNANYIAVVASSIRRIRDVSAYFM